MGNNKYFDKEKQHKALEWLEKKEKPCMIAPGRMEHLEAIIAQIEKYENSEPKWNWFDKLEGALFSVFIFGIGLIWTENDNLKGKTIIYGITIGCGIGYLLCLLFLKFGHKQNKDKYKSETNKMKDILDKTKSLLKNKEMDDQNKS